MKINNADKNGLLKKITVSKDIIEGSSMYIISNNELALFKCRGLVEYIKEKVVLRVDEGIVTVSGSDLELETFSTSEICIKGEIEKIEFSKKEGKR